MNSPDHHEQDAQLRASAQAFHDDVIGTVDLDAALSESQRPSRRPTAIVVSVLAVVALVAGVLLLRPPSDDVDVAIDEDGLEDPEPEATEPDPPAPDFENAPAPIGLGAPDDGKDSVRLPVVVEPSTGLTDGQSVSVSGQGFPPGVSVGVVMCAKEAGQDHGARGVEACNIGHFGQGTSDSEGNVTIPFQVRRIVMLDGQEIDCASEPGRCIIGMGMIDDYDQSGGFAVDFDPSVPLPDPPGVELSNTENVVDGETVELVVTGLAPNTYLYVQQCALDIGCAEIGQVEHRADAAGTFRGSLRLWRTFGVHGNAGPTNVDCAVHSCTVTVGGEASGGRTIPPMPVSFDPTRGARTAPTLRLLDEGPFGPGDRFEVAVDGTTEGDFVDLQVCPTGEECIAYGGGPTREGSTVVELAVERSRGECSGGCTIQAFVYDQSAHAPGAAGGPPPLFPEPIPVTITG